MFSRIISWTRDLKPTIDPNEEALCYFREELLIPTAASASKRHRKSENAVFIVLFINR
jgi:hypothetical protein